MSFRKNQKLFNKHTALFPSQPSQYVHTRWIIFAQGTYVYTRAMHTNRVHRCDLHLTRRPRYSSSDCTEWDYKKYKCVGTFYWRREKSFCSRQISAIHNENNMLSLKLIRAHKKKKKITSPSIKLNGCAEL